MSRASFAHRLGDFLALGTFLFLFPVSTLPAGSTGVAWLLAGLALVLGAWQPNEYNHSTTKFPLLDALLALGAVLLLITLPAPWWPALALLLLGALAGCTPWHALQPWASAGRRAGALAFCGALATGPMIHGMAMLEAWFPSGWVAMLSGRMAGFNLSLASRALVLETPMEDMPFPLSPNWTGFPMLLTLTALVLLWGAKSHGRWWRVPAAWVAVQLWLGLLFLAFCLLGAALDWYEAPWRPLAWLTGSLPVLWAMHRLLPGDATLPLPTAREPIRWSLLTAFLAALLVLLGVLGEDEGQAKAGRVLLDDGHSDWEWVETPMSTDLFGTKTTYNFHGLGRLLSQFHPLTVTRQAITSERLRNVDVLILKTPTRPYDAAEIKAVLRFVRQGGGLYLISDHTNIFGMSTYLNEIADSLGFHFNDDAVFNLWTRGDQVWRQSSPLPHPAIRGVESFHFLTSCSIRPSWKAEVVLAGAQAGSSPVCYHESNFFDPHPPRTEYRWGSLPQIVASRVGRGRVLGFSDSTTGSNFAVFWPGRLEQLLAAVDFLNHRNAVIPWTWLALAAGLGLLGLLQRKQSLPAKAWLAMIVLALALVVPVLQWRSHARIPSLVPPRPLPAASLDTTLSQVVLPVEDKVDPNHPLNLETAFVWLHRGGWIPLLAAEPARAAQIHLVINPRGAPSAGQIQALRRFVEGGGRLVVAMRPSTFTRELEPWLRGLGVWPAPGLVQGCAIWVDDGLDSIWVEEALPVAGGIPFARDAQGRALGAELRLGAGTVVVSGLAECFSTARLGRYDDTPVGFSLEALRLYYRHLGLPVPRMGVLSAERPAGLK